MHFLLNVKFSKQEKKNIKIQNWVLFSLLCFAFITDILIQPVFIAQIPIFSEKWWNKMFRTNICSISVILFPCVFFTKSRFFKNCMIFIGIISGIAAFIFPEEVRNEYVSWFVIRFYWNHLIIAMVPILMLSLNLYKISYKDLYKPVPPFLFFSFYQCYIIFNQGINVYLGFHSKIDYANNSLEFNSDEFAPVFDWLTPPFMRNIPILSTIIPLAFFMTIFSSIIITVFLFSKKQFKFQKNWKWPRTVKTVSKNK